MAFILSGGGGGIKRKIGGDCGDEGEERRYGKRLRRDMDRPPFDDFKRPPEPLPAGGGGPQGVFTAEATLLTEDIKKKMSANHGGIIYSEGRGQPTYHLSHIHETVCFDTLAYDKRQRVHRSQQVCPLGPREALGVQPGAAVYELCSRSVGFRSNMLAPGKDSAGKGVAGFGQRVVTDCVNGMHRDERIRFAGMALNAVSSTDPQADPAMAVASSGTFTITNTGPTTLLPGHTAMFLATPYSVLVNGQMRPGIQEKGVHPEKFRPMIVMADELLSPELAMRAQRVAKEVLEVHPPAVAPLLTFDSMLDAWTRARQKLRTVVIDRDLNDQAITGMMHDVLWIDIYLGWYMFAPGASLVGRDWVGGVWGAEAGRWFTHMENAHWDRAGLDRYAQTQKGVHGKVTWDSIRLQSAKTTEHVENRKVQALTDHRSEVTAQCMGRIMNVSPPGQPLDLCAGYFSV